MTENDDQQMFEQAVAMSRAMSAARGMSRRRFLASSGLLAGMAAAGPAFLAACGGDDDKGDGAKGSSDYDLIISNWDAYIDTDDKEDPSGKGTTIDDFQKATGLKVNYKVDYNDNNEYFNKVFSPYLGTGKPIAADVVMPTYWMAARLIELKWVEEQPLSKIPNRANIDDSYLSLPWDPGAKHHSPWQAGFTGICYNPDLTGEVLSIEQLLTDPALKGKISLLTELRDTVGLTMMDQGADITKVDMDAANAALDTIEKAKKDGQVRAFTGNEYLSSLESGDLAACLAWSGDIVQQQKSQPQLKFVFPEKGATRWFDTMVIPNKTPHLDAAAKWIDWVYDPAHAAKIAAAVAYVSPVKGVQEEIRKLGGEEAKMADSPILFPDAATAARLHVFATYPEKDEIALQKRFDDIMGG